MFIIILTPHDTLWDRERFVGLFGTEYSARQWLNENWNDETHDARVTFMEFSA